MIDAFRDFAEGETRLIWDTKVSGLRVRIGKHRVSWSFFQQHQIHGKRSTTSVTLRGVMTLADARKAALVIAGRDAAGRQVPGKRESVKFEAAFSEYLLHLEAKAKRKGKPARWKKNVVQLGNSILLPEFAKFPLADLSHAPALVRDWHVKVTKTSGPVQANRAAQVLRACYRHAAKLNRSLPPALPTSAVAMNTETPAEKGIADFHKWAAAWSSIPSPVRRGFNLAQLLLGLRPGECSRLEWQDIDCKARAVTVRNTKPGKNLRLPMSAPIARALRMARGADDVLIFPSARHNPVRDELPAYGHALRHAYASIAKALRIDPFLVKALMGHSLGSDVTEGYVWTEMLRGPLRQEQRRISRRIVELLGIEL
jgi:integrase